MSAPSERLDVEAEAERVINAYRDEPLAPCAERGIDWQAAARIGEHVAKRWLAAGRVPCGRKIGLTSPLLRERLSAPQQTEGLLFEDMEADQYGEVEFSRLSQPLVEAEIAIILDSDLRNGAESNEIIASIGAVVPAIEVADCRVAQWRIGYADALLDNASAGRFALGKDRLGWSTLDQVSWEFCCNGAPIEGGRGRVDQAAILNDVLWLAHTAAERGRPLRRGEIILTGALMPPVPGTAGDRFDFRLAGLGSVELVFTESRQ